LFEPDVVVEDEEWERRGSWSLKLSRGIEDEEGPER